MPKILRITNRLNIGGPTYNVAYLTKYLAPEFDTLLLSGMRDEKEGNSEYILHKLGLNVTYLPRMKREISLFDDYQTYRDIRKMIKEYKPDIVHTHMAKPGVTGRLAAIHEQVPVILHTFHGHVFHSYFSPLKTKVFQLVEQHMARHSSGIVAISELQKKELTEDFNITSADKAFVVRLGFDLERFQENQSEKRELFRGQWKIKPDELAIGIIGRLVPVKNHKLFLWSINQVLSRQNRIKVKAFIIGDGELRKELEDYCNELKLPFDTENECSGEKPVVFTSWIKEADVAMSGMDIIALTSLNEGTPVSLIEAQAAGVPIVTTDVGGIRDVVLEEETALIATSGNRGEFTEHLLRLINDSELRKKMAATGPARAKEIFHYQNLVANTRSLYHKLLNTAKKVNR